MDYSDFASAYSRNALTAPSELAVASDTANLTSSIANTIFGVFAAFFGMIIVACIIIWVLQIIGRWKIFTKAGEKGWKAIIPIYSTAILYKVSGMSPWLIFVYVAMFIPIVNFIAGFAITIMTFYQRINICKGFKKSTGFTVAMIMVPFIANLILGLGSSEFVGYENN